ncbi:MAG: response regulator [Candidatus Nomurabacteria bacterium]|nr:MAG: response regulator [Candidatus Nomurabacteria bacterium]
MTKATSSAKEQSKKKNPQVLIVEDDTFLSGMYVTKLELEGIDVELASDGQQAINVVQKRRPDVILLDVVMPKMSGFDVLTWLKKTKETKDIPVILLTNLGEKEDVQKGLKLGAVDYLIKAHFLPSEVVEKIKRIVR